MGAGLAELAADLEAGRLTSVEYDRRVDDLLGTGLAERDPQREEAWERSRR